jgi:hypothetical protein
MTRSLVSAVFRSRGRHFASQKLFRGTYSQQLLIRSLQEQFAKVPKLPVLSISDFLKVVFQRPTHPDTESCLPLAHGSSTPPSINHEDHPDTNNHVLEGSDWRIRSVL